MKKLTNSKICMFVFILTSAGTVTSCREEDIIFQSSIAEGSETNKLKQWFADNEVVIRSKGNWVNSFTPDWNNIENHVIDGKNVYEIGLKNPNKIFSANMKIDAQKADQHQNNSRIKLIIIEDIATGNLVGRFMEMVSVDNFGSLEQLRYKDYKNFTGAINFYQVSGSLSTGWLYKDGNLTAHVKRNVTKAAFDKKSVEPTTLNKLVEATQCGSVIVPHWQETCITVGGLEGWGYSGDSGVTTCHWEIYHTTEIIYCPNDPGGGGGSVGGGGGIDPIDPPSDEELETNPEEFEIASGSAIYLEDHFKCFNAVPNDGASYSITLSADIPVDTDASSLVSLSSLEPGHAFITLTKTNGNTTVSKSFGFYPDQQWLSITTAGVGSKMNDNGGHDYDAMITQGGLTAGEFKLAMDNAISSRNHSYDIDEYNCTNYALDVFNSIREEGKKIEVANWVGSLGFNYGKTPNGLYNRLNVLKNYGDHSINMVKGNAQAKTGACNTQ